MTRSRSLLGKLLLESKWGDTGTLELFGGQEVDAPSPVSAAQPRSGIPGVPWMSPDLVAGLRELGYSPTQLARMSPRGAEKALRERILMTSASILRSGDVIKI